MAQAPPSLHQRVWQIGHPHHTERPAAQRRFLGYNDAAFDLRYSPGLVVGNRGAEWFSDADAAFGSSGSAVLNDEGELVGVYRGGGTKELPEQPTRYRRVIDASHLRTAPELNALFAL